jgi:hypothetical protein
MKFSVGQVPTVNIHTVGGKYTLLFPQNKHDYILLSLVQYVHVLDFLSIHTKLPLPFLGKKSCLVTSYYQRENNLSRQHK